jgi:hypothetical protein
MATLTATELLPIVNWGGTEITRLIIGGNQIRGFSHVSPELDEEMRDYHTIDNTIVPAVAVGYGGQAVEITGRNPMRCATFATLLDHI